MALLFVQTHLSMSLFVQLWQQPHHNTDSTRMDNGTVSCFPSAGKSRIRLIIIILINNSKESPTMFQQSTALKPPSSNQAPHLKLSIQYRWPGTSGSLGVTKTGQKLLMSSHLGDLHVQRCAAASLNKLCLWRYLQYREQTTRGISYASAQN